MKSFSAKSFQWGWFLKWMIGGISWTTLMCSRFLVMLGEEENRLCYFWTGWDSFVLLFGIAIAGVGLALGWAMLNHMTNKRGRRFLRSFVVFLVCFAILQLLPVKGAKWLSWTVLGGGIVLSFFANRNQGAVWSWSGIVLMSLFPLFFLFVWQSTQWESFVDAGGKKTESPIGHSPTTSRPSVFIVLYDSVGAEDFYEVNGGWKEAYPAFAALGKECVTFADAKSPGRHTGLSIPGLLLQRPIEEGTETPWRYWREADQSDSWLLRAKQAGYLCSLIGDYIPWGMVLKNNADWMDVRAYNGWNGLSDRWGHALRDLLLAVNAVRAPWGRFWDAIPKVRWWGVTADVEYRHRAKQSQWTEFRMITEKGPSTGQTVLFHSNLTHDSDYLEDGTLAPTRGTPESELVYVDRIFGEWGAEMKKLGRWDDCWIILTADHSKGFGRRHRHVPFAVKAPRGIRGGTWVEGALPLWELTPFLKSLYEEDSPETSLAVLVDLAGKHQVGE